jgi:hypothetical protein
MYQAILNNKIISSTEFNNKYPNYKELGIYATCPACGGRLYLYGCKSLLKSVNCQFNHFDATSCNLKMINIPKNQKYNNTTGKQLKKEFCKINNMKMVFAVMQNIIYDKQMLSEKIFLEICKQADIRNIWSYINLTLEYLPYVLITLHTFKKPNYSFHYTINKKNDECIDNIWNENKTYILEKRFTETGVIMNKSRNSLTPIPDNNKLPTDKKYLPFIDYKIIQQRKCCTYEELNNPM